jgi:hypothetical protein
MPEGEGHTGGEGVSGGEDVGIEVIVGETSEDGRDEDRVVLTQGKLTENSG